MRPIIASYALALVAPVRERGLKLQLSATMGGRAGRSREGAWIEIALLARLAVCTEVAPVRERGLKLLLNNINETGKQSLP